MTLFVKLIFPISKSSGITFQSACFHFLDHFVEDIVLPLLLVLLLVAMRIVMNEVGRINKLVLDGKHGSIGC